MNLGDGSCRQVDRDRHECRIAAHQRDAGSLHGDIGAGRHGDADIGGSKRRGVVDAIADHGDHGVVAGSQLIDRMSLVDRQHVGDELGDAQLSCHGLRGALVVAGDHDAANAHRAQLRDRLAGTGFDGVAEGQQSDCAGLSAVVFVDHPRDRAPLTLQAGRFAHECLAVVRLARLDDRFVTRCSSRLNAGGGVDIRDGAELAGEPLAADAQQSAFDAPFDASSGQGMDIGRDQCRCLGRGGSSDHSPCERMFAARLQRRSQAKQSHHIGSAGRNRVGEHRMPDGERAGLVKGHHRDALREFERLGVPDQNALAGGHTGTGHDGSRCGQTERAGAGDDQYRHRADRGRLDTVTGGKPADESETGNPEHRRHENR